jgi:RNA polymerase sigma-70 factor (ECF subfamily)
MSRESASAVPQPSAFVAGMAAGDDRALGALYDAYGHVAYGLAFAITGAQATAEAAVLQAFTEAWRSASSFDASRTSVLTWLTSIVRRVALGVAGPVALAATGNSGDRGDRGADGRAGMTTSSTPVGQALRALSAVQQQVIELSYYRGLTVGEIAAQLGEPESSVRELLRSAMQELRSALAGGVAFEDHTVTRA